MQAGILRIYQLLPLSKLECPLAGVLVPAGFPSPSADYEEDRIDLNKELIRHPFTTFFIRVTGDSMEPLICDRQLLIVDRMPETKDQDIVVARIGSDLCVKRLRILDDGAVYLYSENPNYKPIPIDVEDDFEVWGKVMHAVRSF